MELTKKDREYMERVEANTPEGFTLVCGWPDEEYGITWDNYIYACQDLFDAAANKLDEGEDMQPLTFPTFDEWKQLKRDEDEDRDNLGFSHDSCELCGALPGDRHAVTAIKPGEAGADYYTYEVCGDCIQYIANGELPNE